MLDKLQAVANRYEEINSQLYQPEVAAQPDLYSALMKELGTLRPIAEAYQTYQAQQSRLQEAEELLADSSGHKELQQ